MRRKRPGAEQIITKPREADASLGEGATIGQVSQPVGVAEVNRARWARYASAM